METKELEQREKVMEIVKSWSEVEKAKQVAFLRSKGYNCNDDEEIVTAYIAQYLKNGGGLIIGLLSVAVLIFIIFKLLTL